MLKKTNKPEERIRRHKRVRKVVSGTPDCPRLNVFRSNKHIFVQVIDDTVGHTLASASTLEAEFKNLRNTVADAEKLGEAIGKRCIEKGIKTVVFDRNGYLYHGIVKSIADGARKAGLEF